MSTYPHRDSQQSYGEVEVQWNKDRMIFPLPHPSTKLIDFKAIISERTGIPVTQMKLISHGFQLKDDSIALERYRLYEDDTRPSEQRSSGLFNIGWAAPKRKAVPKLVLLGSPETEARVTDHGDSRRTTSSAPHLQPPRPPSPSRSAATAPARSSHRLPEPSDELSTTARIAQLVDEALRQNLPAIEDLEAGRPPSKPRAAAIASELLLQALLQLDGTLIRPEWTQARRERKEAVQTIQAALDRLDAVKAAPPPISHHSSHSNGVNGTSRAGEAAQAGLRRPDDRSFHHSSRY